MRYLSASVICCLAALCFYAGYTLGKSKRYTSPPSAAEVADTTEPEVAEPADQPVTPPAEPDQPEPSQTVTAAPQPSGPTNAEFAARAEKRVLTLKDSQGRELVAELMEVQEDSLKVRRQADYRILNVPVDMLSAGDRAFAAYLWQQRGESSGVQTEPGLSEQELLERIFGDL